LKIVSRARRRRVDPCESSIIRKRLLRYDRALAGVAHEILCPLEGHLSRQSRKSTARRNWPRWPSSRTKILFVVGTGGFYRRWFNLVDDIQPIIDTVATLKATEDEDWVPLWSAVADRYEREAVAAATCS